MADSTPIKNLTADTGDLSKAVENLSKQFTRFSRDIGIIEKGFDTMGSGIKAVTSLVSGYSLAQENTFQNFVSYTQQIDKISRSTRTYGLSIDALDSKLERLSRRTNLSKQTLGEFVGLIEKRLVGMRDFSGLDRMIERIGEISKTAEEARNQLDALVTIQSRFGRRIQTGISGLTPEEFLSLDRETTQQATQFQFARPEQLRNRTLSATQRAEKSYQNMTLGAGKALGDTFMTAGVETASMGSLGNSSLAGLSAIVGTALGGSALFGGAAAGGSAAWKYLGFGKGGKNKKGSGDDSTTSSGSSALGSLVNFTMSKGGQKALPVYVVNSSWGKAGGTSDASSPMAEVLGGSGKTGASSDAAKKGLLKRLGGGITGGIGNLARGAGVGALLAGAGTLGGLGLQFVYDDHLKKKYDTSTTEGQASREKALGKYNSISQDVIGYGSSGAGIGATVGSFIAPGLGTAIGAGAGAIAGGAYGYFKGSERYEKNESDKRVSLIAENKEMYKSAELQRQINKAMREQVPNTSAVIQLVSEYNNKQTDVSKQLNVQQTLAMAMNDRLVEQEQAYQRISTVLSEQKATQETLLGFLAKESFNISGVTEMAKEYEQTIHKVAETELKYLDEKQSWLQKNLSEYDQIKTEINDINSKMKAPGADKDVLGEALKGAEDRIELLKKEAQQRKINSIEEERSTNFTLKRMDIQRTEAQQAVQARMQSIQAAKSQQEIFTEMAEQTERLSTVTRLGLGPSYSSLVSVAQQLGNEWRLGMIEVEKYRQEIQGVESQMAGVNIESEKGQSLLKERQYLERQVAESSIKATNAQIKMFEKMNTLRDAYISALPEMSMGGVNFELDPTQGAGLSRFMTEGGHPLIGGNIGVGSTLTAGGMGQGGGAGAMAWNPNLAGAYGERNRLMTERAFVGVPTMNEGLGGGAIGRTDPYTTGMGGVAGISGSSGPTGTSSNPISVQIVPQSVKDLAQSSAREVKRGISSYETGSKGPIPTPPQGALIHIHNQERVLNKEEAKEYELGEEYKKYEKNKNTYRESPYFVKNKKLDEQGYKKQYEEQLMAGMSGQDRFKQFRMSQDPEFEKEYKLTGQQRWENFNTKLEAENNETVAQTLARKKLEKAEFALQRAEGDDEIRKATMHLELAKISGFQIKNESGKYSQELKHPITMETSRARKKVIEEYVSKVPKEKLPEMGRGLSVPGVEEEFFHKMYSAQYDMMEKKYKEEGRDYMSLDEYVATRGKGFPKSSPTQTINEKEISNIKKSEYDEMNQYIRGNKGKIKEINREKSSGFLSGDDYITRDSRGIKMIPGYYNPYTELSHSARFMRYANKKAVDALYPAFDSTMDLFESAGDQLGRISFATFDTGGGIKGSPGEAVSIVAHAGEVVLNKDQQIKLGLSKNILRQAGVPGFATGGEVGNARYDFDHNLSRVENYDRNWQVFQSLTHNRSLPSGMPGYSNYTGGVMGGSHGHHATGVSGQGRGIQTQLLCASCQQSLVQGSIETGLGSMVQGGNSPESEYSNGII